MTVKELHKKAVAAEIAHLLEICETYRGYPITQASIRRAIKELKEAA